MCCLFNDHHGMESQETHPWTLWHIKSFLVVLADPVPLKSRSLYPCLSLLILKTKQMRGAYPYGPIKIEDTISID